MLGNESCDLDSAVSALTYGYLLWLCKDLKTSVIPVLNIPRRDLILRTEVVFWFQRHGFQIEDLICRDDIALKELSAASVLQLHLVDHHQLAENQQDLITSVVEVVDHRPYDPSTLNPNIKVRKLLAKC